MFIDLSAKLGVELKSKLTVPQYFEGIYTQVLLAIKEKPVNN